MSSSAVKRILAEVRELSTLNSQPGALFNAAPLETDLFEWHFTVRGPPDTPFESGLYHGRILLPPEYPLKPPEIILLTPNGRFEVGIRICLSVTAHHDETWQPSWGIRTILTALIGFMPSKSEGLGALDFPPEERRALARKSWNFACERCGARPAEQFPVERMCPTQKSGSSSQSTKTNPNPESQANSKAVSVATLPGTQAAEAPIDKDPSRGEPSTVISSDNHAVAYTNTLPSLNTGGCPRARAGVDANIDNEVERTALAFDRPVEMAPSSRNSTNHPESGIDGSAVNSTSSSVQPVRHVAEDTKEKELLYLAYAIAVAIVAVVCRRVLNMII